MPLAPRSVGQLYARPMTDPRHNPNGCAAERPGTSTSTVLSFKRSKRAETADPCPVTFGQQMDLRGVCTICSIDRTAYCVRINHRLCERTSLRSRHIPRSEFHCQRIVSAHVASKMTSWHPHHSTGQSKERCVRMALNAPLPYDPDEGWRSGLGSKA